MHGGMKHITFSLLLFSLFISSCGADDEEAITPALSIVGTWDLVDFELYQDGIWIDPDDTLNYTAQYNYQPVADGMRVEFKNDRTILSTGEYSYERAITTNGETEVDYWNTEQLWWIDNGSEYRVEEDQLIISDRTARLFTEIRILTLTEEDLIFEGTIDVEEAQLGFVGEGFARYTLER